MRNAIWGGMAIGAAALALPVGAQSAPLEPAKTASAPVANLEPSDAVMRVGASADGKTLFLVGTITPGSFRKFSRIAAQNPKADTLYLASNGGIVLEGYLISTLVRERKLKTHVAAICASACTEIFIAGSQRTAASDAQIGFHESWWVDGSGKIVGSHSDEKQIDQLVRASHRRSGIDAAFIEKALSTPYAAMWFPTNEELEKAKVLNARLTGPEQQPPFAVGLTRSDLERVLQGQRLWQLVQAREPKLYTETINRAWRQGATNTDVSLGPAFAVEILYDALEGRTALASDAAVDARLLLDLDIFHTDRQAVIDECSEVHHVDLAETPKTDAALIAREVALMTEILETADQKRLIVKTKAARLLDKAYRRVSLRTLFAAEDNDDSTAKRCQRFFEVLEDIATLPPKERLLQARAVYSFSVDDKPTHP